jgi:cell division protein FtsQ
MYIAISTSSPPPPPSPFDLGEVRDRLRQIPLVKEVSVRKLYPDRLLIEITEREPFAIWQKDGKLLVVATDGTPIQELNDQRFTDLPFVVGKGANARVGEFLKIVDSAGDLRSRIRAGILVGERRWTLKMTTGLDVKLPENGPEEAIAQFARLARESRLLDKDLVSIDLRAPGRMYARLTEEAAAVRTGRGLPGCADAACQTFEMHLPAPWRDVYDRVFARLLDAEAAAAAHAAGARGGGR